MMWVDYVILAVLGLSFITGCFRGFVKEVTSLCIWVAALWCAFTYSQTAGSWFQPYFSEETTRNVLGFIAIVIASLIVGGLFNIVMGFILNRSGLSGIDRLLGAGFGFVRGVFLVALVMVAVKMTSLPYQTYEQNSTLYAQFNPVVDWLSGWTPEFIQHVKQLEMVEEHRLVSGFELSAV